MNGVEGINHSYNQRIFTHIHRASKVKKMVGKDAERKPLYAICVRFYYM